MVRSQITSLGFTGGVLEVLLRLSALRPSLGVDERGSSGISPVILMVESRIFVPPVQMSAKQAGQDVVCTITTFGGQPPSPMPDLRHKDESRAMVSLLSSRLLHRQAFLRRMRWTPVLSWEPGLEGPRNCSRSLRKSRPSLTACREHRSLASLLPKVGSGTGDVARSAGQSPRAALP